MLIELNEKNFKEQISAGLKLVDFYAQWCGYCKMLKPELEKLDKIWIGQIDTDKVPSIAREYNVFEFPTIIFFKNGKEVDRLKGYCPKEEILDRIMFHLR